MADILNKSCGCQKIHCFTPAFDTSPSGVERKEINHLSRPGPQPVYKYHI